MYEGTNLEFKLQFSSGIIKTIIAFLNSNGGSILIGYDDHGTPKGLANIDDTMNKISSTIHDTISPDALQYIQISPRRINNVDIIEIKVVAGAYKPYYLKSKGMTPSGVYVRSGATSVPVTEEAIRAFIRDTDHYSWEDNICISQELTFALTARVFENIGVPFQPSFYVALGFKNLQNKYTNLGWLFSDSCPEIIRTACFVDDVGSTVKSRNEFTGPVIKQIDDCTNYVIGVLPGTTYLTGMQRQYVSVVPWIALREAIANAVIHRDHARYGSPITVSVCSDKVIITSVGSSLVEHFYPGASVTRNPKLQQVFYRLRYVEAYGMGINTIQQCYSRVDVKPDFIFTNDVFMVTLPFISLEQAYAEHTTIFGSGS